MRVRTLVTTTAVTALTAVPLVTQTQAPAAAETWQSWYRLAQCESGGDWDINTGNGYYGGLQISGATWKAYGGRTISWRPDQASKAGQIKVAERIQNGQGWGAWPSCSRRAGLR